MPQIVDINDAYVTTESVLVSGECSGTLVLLAQHLRPMSDQLMIANISCNIIMTDGIAILVVTALKFLGKNYNCCSSKASTCFTAAKLS